MIDNPYYSQEAHGPYELMNIGSLELEEGGSLANCTLAVATHGKLNAAYRGPYSAGVRTPSGAAAVRGPYGGVAVRGPTYNYGYPTGAVAAGAAAGAVAGAAVTASRPYYPPPYYTPYYP
jgi:hypothetical protein